MSSDTHSAKRERAEAEGAQERRVSVSSPSGLKCRAAPPVLCASAPGLKSIFFRPPSPFFMQCQAALQVRVHSTTVFRLQVPPPLWSSRAHCPVRGYHPGRVVRRFSIYRWLYLDVGPAIGKFIFTYSLSFPPASFSLARSLSDVAASQVPSVAAAAGFLYSLSSRCHL